VRGALALTLAFASAVPVAARADGSTAAVDAAARAAGNRLADARVLGTALFRTTRSAQVLKVRIDGAMSHEVAGLVLSGVKFHAPLTRGAFLDETIDLVRASFAASAVEEVDCWAVVPLPVGAHAIVSGDMAQPTSKTVFAVSVRRAELPTFAERVRRGVGVFWDPAFATRLGDDVRRPGGLRAGGQP
jgi:hypothetical protein